MGISLRTASPYSRKDAALSQSLATIGLVALAAIPLMAQEIELSVSGVQVAPGAPAAILVAPSAVAEQTRAPAQTPEEKRLAEVLKLKFDRSAISILQTQSTLMSGPPAQDPVEQFRRQVIAGRWKEAEAFLKTFPAPDAAKIYEFLLKELDKVPVPNSAQTQQQQGGPAPAPTLMVSEIADLADLAPAELTEVQVRLLAALLKRALSENGFIDPLVQRLEKGTLRLGGKEPRKRELAALLLLEASRSAEALGFLEPLESGKETKSFSQLEKHIRAIFSLGRQEQKPEGMLRAWQLNQLLLASAECPADHKERAWRRYADIVRFLPGDLPARSLKETFLQKPGEGLSLLKQIGVQVSDDRTNRSTDLRKANLEMQRHAMDAVLAAPERRPEWESALDLFALKWMEEAEYAKQRYVAPRDQQMMQYDQFGNQIYYGNQQGLVQPTGNPNQLPPVPIPELLPSAPGEAWFGALDPALQGRALTLLAELHLKLEEDTKALPYVEKLAAIQPKEAVKISNQLLRVWATAHDPQRALNGRRSNVIYYSGYPMQQGIPLTRALQQRNLEELSAVLRKLRALPIEPLENGALVAAFTAAHSQAEVFKQESIELVFGKPQEMSPETLAELLQTMRQRLATQWRRPNVQQQAKTQRTDAQIDAEVLRGYELLGSLIKQGLEQQPDDWRLNLTQAATSFDLAEFQYGKKVDLAIYVEKREQAFAAFQRAAELYAAKLPSVEQKEWTPQVYQQWLNANLGASDLALVTRQQEPAAKSLERIRNAIVSLPGEAGQRHLDALAKTVTESANTLPAHLKPGFMRAALSIVEDRPESAKIRDLVTYYDGLLREIELSLRIDGDSTVGNRQPFGMFLTVRHTAELERENAGGFSKYLRNPSQSQNYYSPYGTPPVDHRDELEKQMREKMSEGFEVLSITFHDEKVQSRGYGREGWRETPLAYLLLKAKDPAVDRIPSIRLDVDFIDKHGPVILPVESPVQLIDARVAAAPARPVTGLEITQALDDRAISEGKLSLEVKATGQGLVPDFDKLFDFVPAGFRVDEMSDSGPAVQRLSSDGTELAAASERNWLIKLSADPSAKSTVPFQFPRPKAGDLKVAYKRYEDSDLVEVTPEVALAGLPLHSPNLWPWMLIGTVALVTVVVVPMRMRRRLPESTAAELYTMPAAVTPFSVLQLLRRMYADDQVPFSADERGKLAQVITEVEKQYFTPVNGKADLDLHSIAHAWLQAAQRTAPLRSK